MNLRQLETFVRAAELGSFGAAARALHTTQSTISVRIRELEQAFGLTLFDRSAHRAQLTPTGRMLLPSIQQLLEQMARVSAQAAGKVPLAGVARIGVVGRIAYTWLPKLLSAMRALHPAVCFELELGLTATLLAKLRTGELDVALAGGIEAEPGLRIVSLGFDEFVWMAAPSLAIPDRVLGAADLSAWPVLGLSGASPHLPAIEQWFARAMHAINRRFRVTT